MMKKTFLLFLFLTAPLLAQNIQKWRFDLGIMKTTKFETEMQLTNKHLPLGVRINTNDQLGMRYDTTVFRFDGEYRFNTKHSVAFSYYSINSNGFKTITQDIEWDEHTIKGGAQVKTFFDVDIYKFSYRYSFYNNSDIKLMLTVGVHAMQIDLGLDARGDIQDTNGTIVQSDYYKSSSSFTLPLPVFGFGGTYVIVPNIWYARYCAEYFLLDLGDYEGYFIRNMLQLEYRYKRYDIGVSYEASDIYAQTLDGEKKISIQNRLSGFLISGSYTF